MRKLKGWITTTCLAAMIAVSTLNANGGVIITGATSPEPTPCTKAEKGKVDYGVIIAGVTAVIIAGFTGIIIAGVTSEPVEECAIIIAG